MEKILIAHTEERKSSIRLTIRTGLFSAYKYLHLPPLHKLIDRIKLDLSVGSTHTVNYEKGGVENIITSIDGHDLESYWNFLSGERMIIDIIRKVEMSEMVEQNTFQLLQIKFQAYIIKIPIEGLGKLLWVNDEETREIRYIVVIDMLRKMKDAWFYDHTCSHSKCLAIAYSACTGCGLSICGNECYKYHKCEHIEAKQLDTKY